MSSNYIATGSVGSVLSSIGSGIKTVAGGALDFNNQLQFTKGQASINAGGVVQGDSGMPSWLMPVAIAGGLGIVALLVLKKKRAAPTANPGRRRRRHRRRR